MSNLIEEIIELIDELICKRKEIVRNVKDVRNQAEKHHRDSNIAKSVGVTAAAVGGITAIFTAGLSLVVAAAVAGAGAATSVGTSIADPIRSHQFLKKIREISDSQKKIAEKLKEKLEEYNRILKIYAKITGCDERVAAYTIIQAIRGGTLKIPQHAIDIAGAVLEFKEVQKAASRATSSVRSTFLRTGSSQAVKISGKVVLKAFSKGLLIVNIGWDIGDVIYGWVTDHPTVKTMNDFIKKVNESIQELEELKLYLQKKES